VKFQDGLNQLVAATPGRAGEVVAPGSEAYAVRLGNQVCSVGNYGDAQITDPRLSGLSKLLEQGRANVTGSD